MRCCAARFPPACWRRRDGPAAGAKARDEWRAQYPNPWNAGLERRILSYASDLMDAGRAEDAATLTQVVAGIAPDSYLAWRLHGEAKAVTGDRAAAVQALRRALAINPRGEVARLMLARLGEKP